MILSLIFAAWCFFRFCAVFRWLLVGCNYKAILPVLNSVNLFDGPYKASTASTTPSTTLRPTLAQIKYYNYYASSMYCLHELKKLSCECCQKFKKDVAKHTGKITKYFHQLIKNFSASKRRPQHPCCMWSCNTNHTIRSLHLRRAPNQHMLTFE